MPQLGRIAGIQREFSAVRRWLPTVLLQSHRHTSLIPGWPRIFLPSQTHQYFPHRLCCHGYAANKRMQIHQGVSVMDCLCNRSTNSFSTKTHDVLSLDSPDSEFLQYLNHLLEEFSVATQNLSSVDGITDEEIHKLNNTINHLGPLVALIETFKEKRVELHDLSAIIADVACSDHDMVEMAELEQEKVREDLQELVPEVGQFNKECLVHTC